MNDTQPATPNCDKLNEASDERDTVIDFLEWLSGQGYWVGEWNNVWSEERLMPVGKSNDALALLYLGIDPDELERERKALAQSLRGGGGL